MQIRRILALELLTGLRSLDAFDLEASVIDKVVDDILVLRTFAEKSERYREELSKQVARCFPVKEDHPAFAQFAEQWTAWLVGEEDLPLLPLSKAELKLDKNRIPVSTRERLSPLVQA